jgi:hypothetical protein
MLINPDVVEKPKVCDDNERLRETILVIHVSSKREMMKK